MDKKEETKQPVEISYNKNDLSVSSLISYIIPAFECKGIRLFYGFKIYLVIFSKDYASSVSCLENLVKHLESSRRNKNRYEVVPVFYGVSRSAVKRQSGKFGDAFTEHERLYSVDQVTKWRWALAETSELQGHDYNDELSEESEFLEEIAQTVFEKLYPTKEIGIHSRQVEIENLLCKQLWGLRTLGISGMPGIGKTILVRAVFRRMFGGYDDSCFVNDFHTRYSEMTLEPLPSDIFSATSMEKFDLNKSGSEPCYRQKRVLIVLDDVRNAQDAKSFLGEADRFSPGSLIILTSRYKKVLEECQMNEIYELRGLNDKDALKLFTRCAFGNEVTIEQNLLDLSTRVIESSDGNPSALISYSEKLKGKKMTEIESALLKICHDDAHGRQIVNACLNNLKKRSFCFISYGNNYENGDLDSDHHCGVPESVSSDLREPHLDHDPAVPSFPQQLHIKQPVIYQGFACQFNKLKLWRLGGYYKNFSMLKKIKLGHLVTLVEVEFSEARHVEEIDLQHCLSLESIPVTDKLEHLQILNLSGCSGIKYYPDVVRTINELHLEGTGLREIRSEKTRYSKLVKQQSTTTNLELTPRTS